MEDTKDLIAKLNLDFDRHLRIGVTADGDYFVQLIELDPTYATVGEKVIAESDGGLDTCLRNILASIESKNYDESR